MKLPPDERNQKRARIEAALDELDLEHRNRGIGRLYWQVRPTMYEAFENLTHQQPQNPSLRNSALEAVGAGSGLKFRKQSGILMGAFTRNEARVLRRFSEAVQDTYGPPERVAVPTFTLPTYRDFDIGLPQFSAYISAIRRLGIGEDSIPYIRLVRKAFRAAISYYESRHLIDRYEPGLVVVANQHSPGPRGLLKAAIDADIPSIYFPHAPLSTHPCYRDLPVTAAGLRGEREVEFYAGLGANPLRVSSVGDPTISRRDLAVAQGPPILALSPLPVEELSAIVRLVQSAINGRVTVCPHPSSDLSQLQALVPEDWRISRLRTFDEMQTGVSLLIQQSSGVALEALSLGIPVVQLQSEDSAPGYAFLREPYVSIVERDSELREVATAVSRLSAVDRQLMAEWAEEWVGPRGDAAADRGRKLLEEVGQLRTSSGELLLDRFGTDWGTLAGGSRTGEHAPTWEG